MFLEYEFHNMENFYERKCRQCCQSCTWVLKRGSRRVERFASLNVRFSVVIKFLRHTFPCQWTSYKGATLSHTLQCKTVLSVFLRASKELSYISYKFLMKQQNQNPRCIVKQKLRQYIYHQCLYISLFWCDICVLPQLTLNVNNWGNRKQKWAWINNKLERCNKIGF